MAAKRRKIFDPKFFDPPKVGPGTPSPGVPAAWHLLRNLTGGGSTPSQPHLGDASGWRGRLPPPPPPVSPGSPAYGSKFPLQKFHGADGELLQPGRPAVPSPTAGHI